MNVETTSALGSQPSVLRMQDVVIGLPRRRPHRVVVPTALGLLLAVLILAPILFMFLGSVRSAALADPSAHFTFDKLIHTTQPFCACRDSRSRSLPSSARSPQSSVWGWRG
jgi:hypothetical protein